MFKNVFLAGLLCIGSLSVVSASALYFPPNANGMSGTFGYAASGSDISAFNWGADFTYAGKFNISAGLSNTKQDLSFYELKTNAPIIAASYYFVRNTKTQPFSLGVGVSYVPENTYSGSAIDISKTMVSGFDMKNSALGGSLLSTYHIALSPKEKLLFNSAISLTNVTVKTTMNETTTEATDNFTTLTLGSSYLCQFDTKLSGVVDFALAISKNPSIWTIGTGLNYAL